jgi:hypothetical protein
LQHQTPLCLVAGDALYVGDFQEFVGQPLYVVHIMNVQLYFSFKNTIVRFHAQFAYIDVQLAGNDLCDVIQQSHIIYSTQIKVYEEREGRLMRIPFGCDDPVPVTAL